MLQGVLNFSELFANVCLPNEMKITVLCLHVMSVSGGFTLSTASVELPTAVRLLSDCSPTFNFT